MFTPLERCYKERVVEIRILGPLEVVVDARSVAPSGHKQRALLAALAIARRDVVSTDSLVEALWGEEPPRTASTSLQNFVSQLRKALGQDVIETRPPGYRLLQGVELDADRFETLVRASRQSDHDGRVRMLREALALWRGPALADFRYESFAQNEAQRLDDLRVVAQEEMLAAEVELGRHADVVPELESLVRQQPLRERPRAQLMLALYRSGRQAEALDAYHEARKVLVE